MGVLADEGSAFDFPLVNVTIAASIHGFVVISDHNILDLFWVLEVMDGLSSCATPLLHNILLSLEENKLRVTCAIKSPQIVPKLGIYFCGKHASPAISVPNGKLFVAIHSDKVLVIRGDIAVGDSL